MWGPNIWAVGFGFVFICVDWFAFPPEKGRHVIYGVAMKESCG